MKNLIVLRIIQFYLNTKKSMNIEVKIALSQILKIFTIDSSNKILLEEFNTNLQLTYFQYTLRYNDNKLQSLHVFYDFFDNLFFPYLKKLRLLNSHLNYILYIKDKNNIEKILELTNTTLTIPKLENILSHFKKEFNCLITEESYFIFNSNNDAINIECLMIFHEINPNDTYLDFIISKDRIYDYKSENFVRNLLNDSNFIEILNNIYGIYILDKANV